jgi:hypothetical protein
MAAPATALPQPKHRRGGPVRRRLDHFKPLAPWETTVSANRSRRTRPRRDVPAGDRPANGLVTVQSGIRDPDELAEGFRPWGLRFRQFGGATPARRRLI